MAHTTLTAGDLTLVGGDNEAYGAHRADYNGIHALTHRTEQENVFVPAVAGVNLEHIFDGDQELRDAGGDRTVFYEPRRAPMKLLLDTNVLLWWFADSSRLSNDARELIESGIVPIK